MTRLSVYSTVTSENPDWVSLSPVPEVTVVTVSVRFALLSSQVIMQSGRACPFLTMEEPTTEAV